MTRVFKKNKTRGERIIEALRQHPDYAGLDETGVITDALTDLRHAADMLGEDFDYMLECAMAHYAAETRGASKESEV